MEHPGPAIVSMSLLISTNSRSAALVADKVEDLLDAGAIVVVASGNKAGGARSATPLWLHSGRCAMAIKMVVCVLMYLVAMLGCARQSAAYACEFMCSQATMRCALIYTL